jgi:hypothetical protein
MTIKWANIFNSTATKFYPNLLFWLENMPSGSPGVRGGKEQSHKQSFLKCKYIFQHHPMSECFFWRSYLLYVWLSCRNVLCCVNLCRRAPIYEDALQKNMSFFLFCCWRFSDLFPNLLHAWKIRFGICATLEYLKVC